MLTGILILTHLSLPSCQVPQLVGFRDSLHASTRVDVLEKWLGAVAEESALAHVRRAILERRAGELSGHRRYYDRALNALWIAVSRAPRWSSPWCEIGVTKYGMWSLGFLAKQDDYQPVGATYLDGAITALERGISLQDAAAARILGAIVAGDPAARLWTTRPRFLANLLSALGTEAEDHRIRGRILLQSGKDSAAIEAFQLSLEKSGDLLAAAELARALGMVGSPAFDSAYYAAASSDDQRVIELYRADLAYIADSTEVDEFATVRGHERVKFLRDFWARRDHEAMRAPGSRLREHFRRLAFARDHYRLYQFPRRYDTYEPYRSGNAEFDDRGLIYIRHGPPDHTATYVSPGVCYNSTWLYRRPAANLVLHFLARTDPHDWRLIERLTFVGGSARRSVFDTVTPSRGRTGVLYDDCPPAAPRELYESRISIDPIYARLAYGGDRFDRRQEDDLVHRSIETGTRTDSYSYRFPKFLHVVGQAYALLGDRDRGSLLFVYAIAGENLQPSRRGDEWVYPVTMTIQASDTSYRNAVVDTSVRELVANRALGLGEFFSGLQVLPLSAGVYHAGMLVQQDSAGQVVRFANLEIHDSTRSNKLGVSDLVLGREGTNLTWNAPDGPFPLNPLNTYAPGDDALLYYEVYGLKPGASYVAEIEIRALRDNRRGAESLIRLSFTESADASVKRIRKSLRLSPLHPGDYSLHLRLSDAAGRDVVEREQLVHIR